MIEIRSRWEIVGLIRSTLLYVELSLSAIAMYSIFVQGLKISIYLPVSKHFVNVPLGHSHEQDRKDNGKNVLIFLKKDHTDIHTHINISPF